ncbi:hypothetical protein B0T16DRAFT_389781 [Cercophora newfieldiana]|uniref:Uncharacterized protein n=1 Tax=Cercophora newfieldiana TaxID=92897 RepID=A0AA39YF02_9PEZI|nr:hypothetical protein B0T16DRAFT_389781 [Cercophora newfieldiana]
MSPSTIQSLVAALALCAGVSSKQLASSFVSRRVSEYLLPVAKQTHELARVPGSDILLVSQMSNSQLLKIKLDPISEEPLAFKSFTMGKNNESGLHGIWPSERYPGKVWLSLQSENKLLLVDPGRNISVPPSIIKTIDIPAPGNGPHSIFEFRNRVWTGLKVASEQTGQYYVFSADVVNTTDTALYPCLNSPVFIQEEPATRLVYVTQDSASSIMRINVTSGETAQLPIPPEVGVNPVGMIRAHGPLSGLWFTLAGNSSGGSGTFGHIGSKGELDFFHLKEPMLGSNAALLHLADASTSDGPALWLLSTSLLSNKSADALIRVTFDDAVTKVTGQEYIATLTQNAMLHRVLTLNHTVMVTELNTFTLAQLAYKNTVAGRWLPAQTVGEGAVYDEAG